MPLIHILILRGTAVPGAALDDSPGLGIRAGGANPWPDANQNLLRSCGAVLRRAKDQLRVCSVEIDFEQFGTARIDGGIAKRSRGLLYGYGNRRGCLTLLEDCLVSFDFELVGTGLELGGSGSRIGR